MATWHHAASALAEAGAALVWIGTSTPTQTQEFLRTAEVPPFGEFYCEPTGRLQKACGLFRGVVPSLFGAFMRWNEFGSFKALREAARLGKQNSKLVGDSWQQGGTFVFGASGALLFEQRERHPFDFAPVSDAVASLGVRISQASLDKLVTQTVGLDEFVAARRAARTGRMDCDAEVCKISA